MPQYKNVDDRLIVKGLNSGAAIGYNAFLFSFNCFILFVTFLTFKTNAGDGIQMAFICLSIAALLLQYFFVRGYMKIRKKTVVFKKNGKIEFFLGKKYRKRYIGKPTYWRLQKVLHKNHKANLVNIMQFWWELKEGHILVLVL